MICVFLFCVRHIFFTFTIAPHPATVQQVPLFCPFYTFSHWTMQYCPNPSCTWNPRNTRKPFPSVKSFSNHVQQSPECKPFLFNQTAVIAPTMQAPSKRALTSTTAHLFKKQQLWFNPTWSWSFKSIEKISKPGYCLMDTTTVAYTYAKSATHKTGSTPWKDLPLLCWLLQVLLTMTMRRTMTTDDNDNNTNNKDNEDEWQLPMMMTSMTVTHDDDGDDCIWQWGWGQGGHRASHSHCPPCYIVKDDPPAQMSANS